MYLYLYIPEATWLPLKVAVHKEAQVSVWRWMKFHYGCCASPPSPGGRDDSSAAERFPFPFLIWTPGSICVIDRTGSKNYKNKAKEAHLGSPPPQ